jgi:hypothetical protein
MRYLGTLDYEHTIAQGGIAAISRSEWNALKTIGQMDDRLQRYCHYTVKRFGSYAVVMQSGSYGAEPYELFPIGMLFGTPETYHNKTSN